MHQSIFLRLQKEASTSSFLMGLPCLPVASCRPWDAFLVKHSVLGFKQVFGLLRVSQWQTDFVSPTLQQILMRTEARVNVCRCQPLCLQEHSGGTAAAVQGPGSLESAWRGKCGIRSTSRKREAIEPVALELRQNRSVQSGTETEQQPGPVQTCVSNSGMKWWFLPVGYFPVADLLTWQNPHNVN